jgi:hypothetical protein
MSYAKAARDIADLLESGVVLNEVLFAWLAERLAGLDGEAEAPRSNVVFISGAALFQIV